MMTSETDPVSVPKLTETEIESIFNNGGIYLDGERAERFRRVLSDICNAQESLKSSMCLFPRPQALSRGEIDPRYAINSFYQYVEKPFYLVFSALANEDLIDYPFPASDGVE